jgi:hypothetical protein
MRRWENTEAITIRIVAVHEPMTRHMPSIEMRMVTACGFREIL